MSRPTQQSYIRVKFTWLNTFQIHFTSISISSTNSCNDTYVEVFNGQATSSNSVGRYCGTSLPEDLRSFSNIVHILFVAPTNTSGAAAFNVEYRTHTEGNTTSY